MQGAERDGLQDEHVERALEQVGLLFRHLSPSSGLMPRTSQHTRRRCLDCQGLIPVSRNAALTTLRFAATRRRAGRPPKDSGIPGPPPFVFKGEKDRMSEEAR